MHTPWSLPGGDRAAAERMDPRILDPGSDVRYVVTRSGSVAGQRDEDGIFRLAYELEDPRTAPEQRLVLLGRREGLRILAAEVPPMASELDEPLGDVRPLQDLRQVAAHLAVEESDLAVSAVAIGAWHAVTRYCAQCAAELEPQMGGWMLRCPEDATEYFPRTDPAVIMAVRDDRDRLLLARGAHFRGRMFSVLAGFVEVGETLESAVVREVEEETGVQVDEVEYIGSQPWPFPRSLMLGFRAWAPAQDALTLQDAEIAEARWYTREELDADVEAGRLDLPGNGSMGHALIEDWRRQGDR